MSLAPVQERGSKDSKFMPLTNCWICGGKRLVPVHQGLFELEAYAEQDPELAQYTGERFWLNRCRECGFAQPDVTPTLPRYFDRMYDQRWSQEWIEQEFKSRCKDFIFGRVLAELALRVGGDGHLGRDHYSLLDIGAHVGRLIHLASRAGWAAEGIELNPRTSAFAADKTGLPVHRVNAHALVSAGRSFRVVTMLDVLEHIPDPVAMLTTLRRLMEVGGWIAVKVPSGRNQLLKEITRSKLRKNYRVSVADNLVHINHFSPRALKLALERAGFSNIEITVGAPEQSANRASLFSRSALSDNLRLSVYHAARLIPGGVHTPLALNLQAYAQRIS
ncbi:MAG TPA: class I SAM-dependent methyltransferase [Blastocatellia bacterium]|nr:class I SAM-dependent methyltransferase [Blastocatellia bacterium]